MMSNFIATYVSALRIPITSVNLCVYNGNNNNNNNKMVHGVRRAESRRRSPPGERPNNGFLAAGLAHIVVLVVPRRPQHCSRAKFPVNRGREVILL